MRAALQRSLLSSVAALAVVGCAALKPEVLVQGEYRLSWSDLRDIERLLPDLGIARPIDHIYMEGSDRASVACEVRPIDRKRTDNEVVVFTAVRRNGRWMAIDQPRRSHLRMISTR